MLRQDMSNEGPVMSTEAPVKWHIKDVRWKEVIKRQDYAQLLMTCCIVVGILIPTYVCDPRSSEYFIYDATISLPPVSPDFEPSVPNWVPVVIPLLELFFTIVVGEILSSRAQHKSVTDAVATLLYFLADGVQSFICSLLVSQVTKLVVGRTRPDFLARCAPEYPANWTLAIGANVDQSLWPCTREYDEVLKDGYQSFPSGHASISFNITVYASAYLIWCWNMRYPLVVAQLPMWAQFRQDFRNVAAKLWMIVMLALAWGISLSRVIDHQHHISDILGGAFVGIFIALVYSLRAIPRYKRVLSLEPESVPTEMVNTEIDTLRRVSFGRSSISKEAPRTDRGMGPEGAVAPAHASTSV
ncbi:hypothetical protein H632_c680p1 [Helicosporidium sp. ATCC 50920]|nr:hypothetical protein H632_c680p1 [Helicosporidium sp. ATCC 50920]|eukprot:KDD75451.1 hypothetical protein H632_c680p1 [Helicosporidium sp. ATCC 50920]